MKKFLLLLSVVALSFTGCYEDLGPETPTVNEIQLGQSIVEVSCQGASGNIYVNAPYNWTASTDASWIILNTASGEAGDSYLNLTIEFNNNDYDREGTITVFCDDYNLSATISVFQSARDMELLIKRLTNILVASNIYPDFHDDFGYPTMFWNTDHAIGELFPSNFYSGGNQYYDRAHFFSYHYALGPTGACGLIWYHYYQFINEANNLIMVCGNDESGEYYRGIAKAFRALYYLDLARLYDPLYAESTERPEYMTELQAVQGLTVPYVDENTTSEMAANNPRLPREDMFQHIFNDLDDAERCLANNAPIEKNYPSLAVVYGLKARAYLWLGGFEEGLYDTNIYPSVVTGNAAYMKAANYARMAISASGCTPLTESQYCSPTSGFNSINNAWMWGMIQTNETIISNLHSWAAHMSCEAGYGYGCGAQPGVRKATYERMSDTDFRKKLIIAPNAKYLTYRDVTNLTYGEWTTFGLENAGMRTYAHTKFRTNNGEKYDNAIANVVDIPMMRVEEMYFIEAEAVAHYDAATAKQLITSFMSSYRDPNYSTSATDIVEEIIFQKRCEFWGEGVLFYDFKRLNYGIHNAYEGSNTPYGMDFETNGRCPIWNICIPQAEMDKNMALINNPDPSNTLKAKSEMPE